jgi:acetate kinase
MGTRAGDIDPGRPAGARAQRHDGGDLDTLLNQQSGLAGLSGHGNDLRDIERRAAEATSARASRSRFSRIRVRKYIGAYAPSWAVSTRSC